MPRDITPYIPLDEILDPMHFPSKPLVASTWPFVDHNRIGFERICLPTIMSSLGSYAFPRRVNGNPGEGQLWDKVTHSFIEPTVHEKEQLLGYRIDDTMGGGATILERIVRLGQVMDGNTLRWMGAMMSPAHTLL